MHGVKRSRISPEAAKSKREAEQSKIDAYRSLSSDCLARKKAKDYSQAAFDVTNKLLDFNPEFYTVWNYRRDILLHGLFPAGTAEDRYRLLVSDLRLTTSYLKVHPKVYWIWTHRMWCLENLPDGPEDAEDKDTWRNEVWAKELFTVEKMLEVDARNFHAWNYRRWILSALPATFKPPRTDATELKFTTRKIESNFSNFSAWHQRTKVLGRMWETMRANGQGEEADAVREAEFELVTQALWTDPADQSGWLYHRWLIGDGHDSAVLPREIDSIKSLLEAEPDAKWPLESLVHYSTLLLPRLDTDSRSTAVADIKTWLDLLQQIDPYRKARYAELLQGLPLD